MRKAISMVLAVLAIMAIPATALAANGEWSVPKVGTKNDGYSNADEKYLNLYVEAAQKFGVQAVGRNIVDDGLNRPGTPAPSDSQVQTASDRLDLMLHPPAPAPAPAPTTTTTATTTAAPTTTTTTSSGGYTIPDYIVQCESGGSYTAQNPSGAYGAYQIMPATAQAYGCDLSTASGQDQCAAAIYADVGPSAWSCG